MIKEYYDMSEKLYACFSLAQQSLDGILPIDYFFANEMLAALNVKNQHKQELGHLFYALNVSLREGHTCLPLTEVVGKVWGYAVNEEGQATHHGYQFAADNMLQKYLLELAITERDFQPLVFENNVLYLRRYYQFEQELQFAIKQRLSFVSEVKNSRIQTCLAQLFPPNKHNQTHKEIEVDWQKVAVANALNKHFTVIAGGPGTGKTYTVTKLLAALIMLLPQSISKTAPFRIALVAPTGKAAQRLSESIVKAVAGFKGLINKETLAAIPTKAQTIHRLLGTLSNSPNFRHDHHNPLAYELLLIDEVSMVDLPLMTRVFRALKPTAKVILLGDADQLPSVATGSVLADLAPRPHGGFSKSNVSYLAQVTQVDAEQLNAISDANRCHNKAPCYDYLSFLVKSRRFDDQGGIGLLANAVISGDVETSWNLLLSSNNQDVTNENQLSLVGKDLDNWLLELVNRFYLPMSACANVSDAFCLMAKFRVLCVTRKGHYGVEKINETIQHYLCKKLGIYTGNVTDTSQIYHGKPIMVCENDYQLGLYNGDIGIAWKNELGQLTVYFEAVSNEEASNKNVRAILPSRLPTIESVYAMTIHKTQGSEFDHVAMALGYQSQVRQTENKLLSRELLYTGITRAKKKLTIASDRHTWQCGVQKQVKRFSNLRLVQ